MAFNVNEDKFRDHLKQLKKPANTINSYINRVKTFESYLMEKNPPKGLDEATREDIEDFAMVWGREKGLNVYQYLWGVQYYYLYTGDILLRNTSDEMKEWVQLEKYRLRDFQNIDKEHVKKLGSIGIRTARQLLERGRTPAERTEFELESGVPLDYIVELVKLSNLARIGGLKKKRARLFFDAGLDTLDKIASKDPNEVIDILSQHIERTGFDGRVSSTSEAEHTVSMAKFLRRIIEY